MGHRFALSAFQPGPLPSVLGFLFFALRRLSSVVRLSLTHQHLLLSPDPSIRRLGSKTFNTSLQVEALQFAQIHWCCA
jgi:hypothetical protein